MIYHILYYLFGTGIRRCSNCKISFFPRVVDRHWDWRCPVCGDSNEQKYELLIRRRGQGMVRESKLLRRFIRIFASELGIDVRFRDYKSPIVYTKGKREYPAISPPAYTDGKTIFFSKSFPLGTVFKAEVTAKAMWLNRSARLLLAEMIACDTIDHELMHAEIDDSGLRLVSMREFLARDAEQNRICALESYNLEDVMLKDFFRPESAVLVANRGISGLVKVWKHYPFLLDPRGANVPKKMYRFVTTGEGAVEAADEEDCRQIIHSLNFHPLKDKTYPRLGSRREILEVWLAKCLSTIKERFGHAETVRAFQRAHQGSRLGVSLEPQG